MTGKQDKEKSVPALVPDLLAGPEPLEISYMCLLSDVQPPEGRSRDGLLTVNLREGSKLHLCAETRDDAM